MPQRRIKSPIVKHGIAQLPKEIPERRHVGMSVDLLLLHVLPEFGEEEPEILEVVGRDLLHQRNDFFVRRHGLVMPDQRRCLQLNPDPNGNDQPATY